MDFFDLVVILGATAAGKTRAAVQVARSLRGEIISADSRQIYRGMDIGTGKDLREYGEIPYHLIDIRDPGEEFSVYDFQKAFSRAFAEIRRRGNLPVLAGGTGLYLESALLGYQLPEVPENPVLRRELSTLSTDALRERLKKAKPRLHNTTDLEDRSRLVRALEIAESAPRLPRRPEEPRELKPVVFGIRWDREALRRRITLRLRERLAGGMIAEAERLIRDGHSFERLEYFGLEYRYAALFLKGKLKRNDLFQKLNSAIHQLAKRQETWFRRMERRGVSIYWVRGEERPAEAILEFLGHPGPSR